MSIFQIVFLVAATGAIALVLMAIVGGDVG